MYEIFKIKEEELRQYIIQGYTYDEIAEVYGCSCWTVMDRVSKYKLGNLVRKLNINKTRKLGEKNPAKRPGVKKKIKNTISKYYAQGIKMGFQNLEKVSQVIDRKKYLCEFCGSKKCLKWHHIDGNQSNHLKTNTEVLCSSCHIYKHYQPYMIIGRIFRFESAHQLKGIEKCKRLHGHSYKMEVIVGGRLDKNGMVMNFGKLDKIVCRRVIDKIDHYFLNTKMKLEMPTAENMLVWIFKELNEELKGLKEIRLWETENSVAIIKDSYFTDMFSE